MAVAALGALLAAGPAFARARVQLTPRCYLSNEQGTLIGRGFAPNATWTAKLGGRRTLGTGRTDARGRLRARFTAPTYRGTRGTRRFTLAITDGPNVARTTFLMSPLSATFRPRTGDPARLRVRWRVLGIGPRRGVYVHYLNPRGRHRRTVRIGTSDRVCGALKTGPIALFPFRYAFGTWTLQVDTARRWSPRTRPRLEIAFAIRRPRAEADADGGDDAPRDGDAERERG